MGHIRQTRQTGDDPDSVRNFFGERCVGLRLLVQYSGVPFELDTKSFLAAFQRQFNRRVLNTGQRPRNVFTRGGKCLRRDPAVGKDVADPQKIPLPHRLVVYQERHADEARDALDLDSSATLHISH